MLSSVLISPSEVPELDDSELSLRRRRGFKKENACDKREVVGCWASGKDTGCELGEAGVLVEERGEQVPLSCLPFVRGLAEGRMAERLRISGDPLLVEGLLVSRLCCCPGLSRASCTLRGRLAKGFCFGNFISKV